MSAMARAALALLLGSSLASAAVHSGFLYDELCVDRGVGIDGVDTRTEPQRHTVHCLLVSICRNSGYGLLTKPSGQSQYSMEVLLSERGNADVVTWLGTQEYWGTNVKVEISGPYDSQGRLHVETITRDGSVWNGSGAGTAAGDAGDTGTSMASTTAVTSSTGSTLSSSTPGASTTPSSSKPSTTPSATSATGTTPALAGSDTTAETSTSAASTTLAAGTPDTSTSAALATSAAGCARVLLAFTLIFFLSL